VSIKITVSVKALVSVNIIVLVEIIVSVEGFVTCVEVFESADNMIMAMKFTESVKVW
jgi:hypothetical protein